MRKIVVPGLDAVPAAARADVQAACDELRAKVLRVPDYSGNRIIRVADGLLARVLASRGPAGAVVVVETGPAW